MSTGRHACPCLAVAGEHPRCPGRAQVTSDDERPDGPLPDVLARLATDMPASDTGRGRSQGARALGWALMAGTAVLVLVAVFLEAHP